MKEPCGGAVATVQRHHRTHQDATAHPLEGRTMAKEMRHSGRFWIPNMVAILVGIMLLYRIGIGRIYAGY